MAEKTKPSKTPNENGRIVVTDDHHAPFIFFDGAPNFGSRDGVVNITLAVARHLVQGDQIKSDVIVAAHLRCNVQAAMDLRRAIDDALLLATEAEGAVN